MYLSAHLSAPIDRITRSAEELAKGNFSTKFDGRGYLEAKKLADTLTYAEKELSKVDTMQRDLIANVSHDLKTPLTSIIGYADTLRSRKLPEEQQFEAAALHFWSTISLTFPSSKAANRS